LWLSTLLSVGASSACRRAAVAFAVCEAAQDNEDDDVEAAAVMGED
jgi:hypothetical protein